MDTLTKEIINDLLSGSYTPKGIEMWWKRKRLKLGFKTPEQVWDEGNKLEVYDLAYSLAVGGMGT